MKIYNKQNKEVSIPFLFGYFTIPKIDLLIEKKKKYTPKISKLIHARILEKKGYVVYSLIKDNQKIFGIDFPQNLPANAKILSQGIAWSTNFEFDSNNNQIRLAPTQKNFVKCPWISL